MCLKITKLPCLLCEFLKNFTTMNKKGKICFIIIEEMILLQKQEFKVELFSQSLFTKTFEYEFKNPEARFFIADPSDKVVCEWNRLPKRQNQESGFIAKVRIPRSMTSKSNTIQKSLLMTAQEKGKHCRIKPLANSIIIYFDIQNHEVLASKEGSQVILQYMDILYKFKNTNSIDLKLVFRSIESFKAIATILKKHDPSLEEQAKTFKKEHLMTSMGFLFAVAKNEYAKSSHAILHFFFDVELATVVMNRSIKISPLEQSAIDTLQKLKVYYNEFADFISQSYYQVSSRDPPSMDFIIGY